MRAPGPVCSRHLPAAEYVVWGVVVHFVVDWLLQNEWMALNKEDLRHPAGYVHAALHGIALLLVFPVLAALALAVAHFAIDTRRPLQWWSRVMTQTATGPEAFTIHLWRDQALHIGVIAIAALIVA